jgi:hypothetical protein
MAIGMWADPVFCFIAYEQIVPGFMILVCVEKYEHLSTGDARRFTQSRFSSLRQHFSDCAPHKNHSGGTLLARLLKYC